METKTSALDKAQPKVLYLSFISSMFERYGYYIISFLLTLYVKNVYNYSDANAFALFALFSALGYLTPAIGGYLADNVVGIKRCWIMGLIFEAGGLFVLSIPTSNLILFYLGLGAIIVGAGIFKTAPTNALGRAYEKDDPRIDSGFTLFYMGINVGSFVSSLIAGAMVNVYGWHMPYLFAAIGLTFGIIYFIFFKHYADHLESKAGKKNYSIVKYIITILAFIVLTVIAATLMNFLSIGTILLYLAAGVVVLFFVYQIMKSSSDEKKRIIVGLILMFMAGVFFVLYYQAFTSMTMFVSRNVNRHIFGINIPAQSYVGLNALWVIILGPIVAALYKFLDKHKIDPAITTKFPIGILLVGLCFISLTASSYFAGPDAKVSSLWIVFAFFLYSAGELLTSALGLAMVTRIMPRRLYGIAMGAWFLISTALAAQVSGSLAGLAAVPANLQGNLHATLCIYSHAFTVMGSIAVVVAIVGFIISPWLKKAANLGNNEQSA
jgi:proton-dependent oligopeptide transporter, POT family